MLCFIQIAIGTDDVYKTAEVVKLSGGKVVQEAGPLPGINTKITSILDPAGWKSVSPLFPSFLSSDALSFKRQLPANRSETKALRPIVIAGVCGQY